MVLTCTVVGAVILPITAVVIFPDRAEAVKSLASILVAPLIGVYGTVLGFYFSESK